MVSGKTATSAQLSAEDDTHTHTRRRGVALEDAILEAVWDEVRVVGYANLTMESAAACAKTSKAVIYRRWPSRAALVHAAMHHHLGSIAEEIPDTGSLRGDVLTLLRWDVRRFDEVGLDLIHGLTAESHDLPPEIFVDVPNVMKTILQRAAARGEIRMDKITPRIAWLPIDLIRHEILFPQRRNHITEATLAEIVDDIFLPLVRA